MKLKKLVANVVWLIPRAFAILLLLLFVVGFAGIIIYAPLGIKIMVGFALTGIASMFIAFFFDDWAKRNK